MPTEDSQSGRSYACALDLPEIRLQIFRQLSTRDLLNAALVCKAWTWPATDTAWRSSKFRLSWLLASLLNCTAGDMQRGIGLYRNFFKVGGVTPEEWDSRLQRAGKITHLIVDLSWKATVRIITTELSDPIHGPICPHLLSFELDIDGLESSHENADRERWTPLLPLLVGPDLEKLSLSFYAVTERVVQDIIQTLTRIAPQIHTVRIINSTKHSPDYFAFTHVKWLTVRGHISHQTWQRLASCPRLEGISLLRSHLGHNIKTQPYSVTFPHVKSFSVDLLQARRDAEFALALLQGATMPELQNLEINYPTYDGTTLEAVSSELLRFMHRSLLLKEGVINGRVIQKG
ncbi:hypothetical protein FRB95_010869 [Tulasnella sp. JGI-2019a]|nr:hypothetical protein FRB95_010869 [Tulasnella sp. JGI-2019a]